MGIIKKGKLILQRKTKNFLGLELIEPLYDRMAVLSDIYLPALVHHQEVFPKYKNINKGKTVVIVGGGHTLDYYTPISDAIHIAINYSVRRRDIKYDYCFTSDYDSKDGPDFMNEIQSYGDGLISFMAINYERLKALIPEFVLGRDNVEWYYVDCYDWGVHRQNFNRTAKFFYPLDLSMSPLKSYGTTMFGAFQFALWTHPDKIYLVGADCSKEGHAGAIGYTAEEDEEDYSYLIPAWKKSKEFAAAYYPDIRIESINPVGLKGVFEDKYTDEYIKRRTE